jgi:hypothetical protein
MTSSTRTLLLGLAAFTAAATADAQTPSTLVNRAIALEVPASSIVLPLSSTSAAVFPPCGGCAPKSFPATSETKYYLRRNEVTAADLKIAILGKSDMILTVKYSADKGELVSITAPVDAPRLNAPAKR